MQYHFFHDYFIVLGIERMKVQMDNGQNTYESKTDPNLRQRQSSRHQPMIPKIYSNPSRKPNSNSFSNCPKTTRTWLTTDRFPNSCTYFQLRTNRRQTLPSNRRTRLLTNHMDALLAVHPITASPPNSLQSGHIWRLFFFLGTVKLSSPLPAFESLTKASDGGRHPFYSKFCINSFCLFSLGWSSLIPTEEWECSCSTGTW